MRNLTAKLRARRAETRTQRALSRAIDTAANSRAHDEALALARTRHTHVLN